MNNMNKLAMGVGLFLLGIAVLAVVCVILAFPIKWLWNSCLVGTIDGVHTITAWKALGISVLCGILVKGSSSGISKKD